MKLHIISSFHYDYIYLKDSEEYFEISFRILDKALEMLEKEHEWCFTIEQTILVEEYLRRFPEKKHLMQKFVQEKRLSFAPGMYVMPDMNMIDLESLCLQAKYGKKFLKENFSCDAKVCWIADCWGHHAQLPQILKQCTYDGYFFWRCMRRDVKKNDFYWQGLDGTKIFTHWTPLGYAGISFPSNEAILHGEELSFSRGTSESILALAEKLLPFHEKKESRPLLLCNGGDFRMPQETGPSIVKTFAAKKDFPETEFSTPEKFVNEMLSSGVFGTVKGEFNGSFQGTYSTNILIKQLLYYTREMLLARETLAALCDTEEVTEELWKKLLRHYFHDSVCGTICDDGRREIINELQELNEALQRKSHNFFNPLLRKRREIVETEDGRHFLVELLPLESRNIDSFEEMPPLKEVEDHAGSFQNPFFSCSFDEMGRIIFLATPGGKSLVNSGSPAPFALPVMNRDNGDNWIYYDSSVGGGAAFTDNRKDTLYPEKADEETLRRGVYYPVVEECKTWRSEKEYRIEQKGYIKFWRIFIPFTLQTVMDQYSPLIRFTLKIVPDGKYYRLRAAFPTDILSGRIHHGIPGGFTERPNGEYPAESFIHYGDEKGGLFLLNKGIPGNSVDENNVMLLSLFRSVAMEYKCESTASFNEEVPHTFEYAVFPHDGAMDQEANSAVIENYRRNISCAEKEYKDFFWRSLPGNIHLYSLRKHPAGLFLRLGEVCGRKTKTDLSCRYRDTDALENLLTEEKTGEIEFKPFEIRNIVLIREKEEKNKNIFC